MTPHPTASPGPTAPTTDPEVRALPAASGGRPIVQIVYDPEADAAGIRSAGLDHAVIPRSLLSIGRALTGER